MEKIGLNELRKIFLDFYKSKDHYVQKSFSLIPEKDKSLLIINSGMAPLKPYFAGIETPPSKRMTTCQKCIRTGDIENVGYTARHGTFFEMLGSFSFGDYFKKESIKWGWEFVIDVLKLPEDKLWASIYEEDEEAYDLWANMIGIPKERIVRLGKADNFWEIGTGPCGPCSEIYYDRGEKYGCENPDCKPGCDCDRYIEFWNHVFTQFNRDDEGNYTPLANPNIDTGLGLERLACLMQGVDSIFEIDTIRYILDEVVRVSGVKYEGGTSASDVSLRIITDHIRSVVFMIGDGILPSNEGRGYVLRRLLRRAARHGKLLGINTAFLAELSKKVVEISGDAYPELKERQEYIHRILSIEEEKFSQTIDQGTVILMDHIKSLKAKGETVLSGEDAFRLYDTYGFPVELTQEILEENGCKADEEGFRKSMDQQKEMARAARKSDTDAGWADDALLFAGIEDTMFTGYDVLTDTSVVKGIFQDKKKIETAEEGDTCIVVLDRTPFYAESGGQKSDAGFISSDGVNCKVVDVTKFKEIYLHKVEITAGSLSLGDSVTASVADVSRNDTARNHTATHLLHRALKEVIGDHVEQAGSSVAGDSLRFDFTHFEGVGADGIKQIEDIVNYKIRQFIPVTTQVLSIEDASKTGAVSLFGEKYGDMVRVVSIGDFSSEFCGGTHVSNTGQIGAFKILSEGGVAGGVRRIEAITGAAVYNRVSENDKLIKALSEKLKTNHDGLLARAVSLNEELKVCKKELEQYKQKDMGSAADEMLAAGEEVNGITLITKSFEDQDTAVLRSFCDQIKEKTKNYVIVLASTSKGKVNFIVAVSDDLQEKGIHAGKLIKEIAAAAGGGGGGKADLASAGAKDPSKIQEAFAMAKKLL